MHPIMLVLNHSILVCMCLDDPVAFEDLGLLFDFYQMLVSCEQTAWAISQSQGLASLLQCAQSQPVMVPFFSVFNTRSRRRGVGDCIVEEEVDKVFGRYCLNLRFVMSLLFERLSNPSSMRFLAIKHRDVNMNRRITTVQMQYKNYKCRNRS